MINIKSPRELIKLFLKDDINILNDIIKSFNINKKINNDEYKQIKNFIYDIIITLYPNISFITNYLNNKLCLNNNFITCESRDLLYDKIRYNVNLNLFDNNMINKYNQYEILINLPQPQQKTKEWYNLRNNMITASSCGTILGDSPYNSIKEILLEKIGFGKEYKENDNVYHGKKYEKIAIMIYEHIYNTKIGEFGLIQHPEISYLGASPDGISMSMTLDGKPNKLLGRMIEIKCPVKRKIKKKGKLKGDICPSYYMTQILLQLECCNLEECDFWQCSIIEYNNEEEYLNDIINNELYTENELYEQNIDTVIINEPKKININPLITKGMIIELLPYDKSNISVNDKTIWYAKYIYPPLLIMTYKEYKQWFNIIINNLYDLYPEYKNYYYSRIIYWKLDMAHNELITRKKNWFNNNKNIFEIFWKRVLYYRNNKEEAENNILKQNLTNKYLLSLKSIKIPNKILEINNDIFLSSDTE